MGWKIPGRETARAVGWESVAHPAAGPSAPDGYGFPDGFWISRRDAAVHGLSRPTALFWSAPAKRRGRMYLSAGGYQQPLPGAWVPGSTRAAATALSPRHSAQSKAAAGRCTITDSAVTSGTTDSGRYRGQVAAALQKVRRHPAMIVSSPESIKSQSIYLRNLAEPRLLRDIDTREPGNLYPAAGRSGSILKRSCESVFQSPVMVSRRERPPCRSTKFAPNPGTSGRAFPTPN